MPHDAPRSEENKDGVGGALTFIQTLQVELLDSVLCFGPDHFDYLVSEFLAHYHTERPHQGKDNRPLKIVEASATGEVVCSQRLGGLLKHYYRKAA